MAGALSGRKAATTAKDRLGGGGAQDHYGTSPSPGHGGIIGFGGNISIDTNSGNAAGGEKRGRLVLGATGAVGQACGGGSGFVFRAESKASAPPGFKFIEEYLSEAETVGGDERIRNPVGGGTETGHIGPGVIGITVLDHFPAHTGLKCLPNCFFIFAFFFHPFPLFISLICVNGYC
jgi:hypothetical protein